MLQFRYEMFIAAYFQLHTDLRGKTTSKIAQGFLLKIMNIAFGNICESKKICLIADFIQIAKDLQCLSGKKDPEA